MCWKSQKISSTSLSMAESASKIFKFDVPLDDGYEPVELTLKPLFADSIVFIVQYPVPFKLNVAADPDNGVPTVTKAGEGGK